MLMMHDAKGKFDKFNNKLLIYSITSLVLYYSAKSLGWHKFLKFIEERVAKNRGMPSTPINTKKSKRLCVFFQPLNEKSLSLSQTISYPLLALTPFDYTQLSGECFLCILSSQSSIVIRHIKSELMFKKVALPRN